MRRLFRSLLATVGSLFQRFQQLIRELAKFGIVGGINVGVNFLVFLLLAATLFVGSELKANVVATVVATTSSYVMNRYWTFRHRPRTTVRREYTLFFVFNAAGLLIELAVMGAAKYGLGLTTLSALTAAKAVGIGLGTIFRFWTYRTFVFASRPAGRTREQLRQLWVGRWRSRAVEPMATALDDPAAAAARLSRSPSVNPAGGGGGRP